MIYRVLPVLLNEASHKYTSPAEERTHAREGFPGKDER